MVRVGISIRYGFICSLSLLFSVHADQSAHEVIRVIAHGLDEQVERLKHEAFTPQGEHALEEFFRQVNQPYFGIPVQRVMRHIEPDFRPIFHHIMKADGLLATVAEMWRKQILNNAQRLKDQLNGFRELPLASTLELCDQDVVNRSYLENRKILNEFIKTFRYSGQWAYLNDPDARRRYIQEERRRQQFAQLEEEKRRLEQQEIKQAALRSKFRRAANKAKYAARMQRMLEKAKKRQALRDDLSQQEYSLRLSEAYDLINMRNRKAGDNALRRAFEVAIDHVADDIDKRVRLTDAYNFIQLDRAYRFIGVERQAHREQIRIAFEAAVDRAEGDVDKQVRLTDAYRLILNNLDKKKSNLVERDLRRMRSFHQREREDKRKKNKKRKQRVRRNFSFRQMESRG